MDRKEMVKILGEHFGVKPKYLGAPSFQYQIETPKETYIIDREGKIMTSLGAEVELEELLAGPEEPIGYELEIPMDGHSGRTLRNIVNMIYSRQPLIKKALGIEENIVEEDFVIKINEADINSVDSFERALNKIEEGGHPGIEFDFQGKSITFKHTGTEAATWLFALINKNAKAQSRALAKVKPTDNEKYTFRTWLTRLGMIGDEYKEIRRELLQNLSGNSAFRKGKKEEAND
ncbi:virulence-related protein [Clostridium cochlearium]|uniref:virulence-related protein n=1 Tax=Clostridium cochlearium TaxID=1494 RepID=UPI000BBC1131|nr:virulence-related protein [Clostridium cochlearium]